MPRKRALVTQHLESISREALEKYQNIIREYIRHRHGIYALYRRNKLYYVGLTSNLPARLQSHLRDKHAASWDRFSVYLTIGHEHMKELESLLLRIVDPVGNSKKGRFAKSEDLRRKFGRSISELQKEERARLMGGRGGRSKQAKKKGAKKPLPKKSNVTGRRPILARYISQGMTIRVFYKGKTYRARVRKDGTISYRRKIYNSPSLAARAVCGHAASGWRFWQYQRSPGDWVPLKELRKK